MIARVTAMRTNEFVQVIAHIDQYLCDAFFLLFDQYQLVQLSYYLY